MKSDSYTKLILTVIALCLVIIVVRDIDIIPKAHANEVSNTKYGALPINEDGSITVRLSNSDQIDVNIKNIDTYDKLRVDLNDISTQDELDINIDEIGGRFVSNGGPIKVTLQN
ncbi:hypothetical protein D1816_11910 [Aquimarina sp. AD10]|uniref:hypothetical protein n=1 Tax=Aquimarina sp. AD10 TaxID=1714849 RepID=UPI000E53E9AA|nr:hypothetical protein [Aquimarina sp. AD10]AXT61021.1 hypothetical protein D1816_11910 [Aquimarina sp. AD10]RKM96319.1 hypothetical protein D7033_15645 [Aquimarina sp. AD10]